FQNASLSYRELNERANRLAHYLIGKGFGPESVVGIALERSLEMVVSLFAVLKSGAAYLPLDPSYPRERLAFMLADAAPALLLTTSKIQRELPEGSPNLVLDDLALAGEPTSNPSDIPVSLQNPAYIIYTSGSTGTPKGVAICHQELSNYIWWARHRYETDRGVGAPVNTPLAFDATVTS